MRDQTWDASAWSAGIARLYRETGVGIDRTQPHAVVAANTIAMTASTILVRSIAGRLGAAMPPGVAMVGKANVGVTSASPNFAALSNRSAANFSSALAVAAATFGGTDLRSSVTRCAGSAMIFMMICCAEDPVCGGSPVSIS